MLYRIAIIQAPNNKFAVQKIAYSKLQDRMTTAYFIRETLGPLFNTLGEATTHAQEILDMLAKIERNTIDQQDADEHERETLRQRGIAFLQYLNQLTRVA